MYLRANDPSIRYDGNTYGLPASVGGAFYKGGFSPRVAVAYQPRPDLIFRASYGTTSTFIPVTYIYNNSIDGIQAAGQYRSPYLPGAVTDPSLDHNVDFSAEKAFPDGQTSMRLTPY